MNEQTTPKKNYPLYLPDTLRARLEKEAARQHRSLHNLILHALTEYVSESANK